MLEVYTGTPGSGKSLHAVQEIYNGLRYRGQLIISNIAVKPIKALRSESRYCYIKNSDLTVNRIKFELASWYDSHPFSENGAVLILDEAQTIFNSRTWNETGRSDWLYFFQNSRHYGLKVIFVTQSLKFLDSQIRNIVELETNHRNVKHFGFIGRVLSLFFLGNLFCNVTFFCGCRQKVSQSFTFGRKHLLKLYDSYTLAYDTRAPT